MSYTAPHWQMSGIIKKEIPLVPYDSFNEYTTLLDGLIKEYSEIVRKWVKGSLITPWTVAHYGLLGNNWGGEDVFLRLTNGLGTE